MAHDGLGLGPRDQNPPVDHQVEGPEGPRTEYVLEGFTGEPTFDHGVDPRHSTHGDQFFGTTWTVRSDPESRCLLDDPTGLLNRQATASQPVGRYGQHLTPGDSSGVGLGRAVPGTHPQLPPSRPSANCRVRSSVSRLSVTSSRSPARIRSNLWRVRLMRWSVRRFSLKL